MPREVPAPEFPETPAAWLSRFRHRYRDSEECGLSPERLGQMLGVSGATVRRWEAGTSSPSESDLRHFAAVCRLSHLETEFILAACKPRDMEVAPDRDVFEAAVNAVLLSEHPAYLLDSLFYRRAWNSQLRALTPRTGQAAPTGNVLVTVVGNFNTSGTPQEKEEFMSRWIHDFWIYTAHLCGTEAYRALLDDLGCNPVFRRKWSSLGLSETPGEARGLPYYYSHPRLGTYRIFTLRLMVPPVYYLKEYVPVDEPARRHVDRFRAATGPTRSIFTAKHHWSLEQPGSRENGRLPAAAQAS